MSYFIFPLDTHPKCSKAKENYESFYKAPRVNLVKFKTITSSKAPKPHGKLITYINIDNGFDLLIAFVFAMGTQLGGLGPNYQDLVIYFHIGEGGTTPKLHLGSLQDQSNFVRLKYEKVQIKNLIDKWITELSKLKQLQFYMTTFEIEYRKFEWLPQRDQLTTTFQFTTEEVFETLEKDHVEISTSHSMIEPIVNWNFINTSHHQNGKNQHQHFHKIQVNRISPDPIKYKGPNQFLT